MPSDICALQKAVVLAAATNQLCTSKGIMELLAIAPNRQLPICWQLPEVDENLMP